MKRMFSVRAPALVVAVTLFASLAHAQDGWSTPEAEPPAAAPAPAQSREGTLTSVLVAVEVGYARQSLYATPIDACDASLVIGADLGDLSAGVVLEATPGVTQEGLHTYGGSVGGFVEGRIGRVRIGGGLHLGVVGVTRITDGGDLTGASAGLFVRASVDLIPIAERSAVYFVGKAGMDDVGTVLTSVSIGLGVRF
jgi:hypothetical protein